MCGSREGGRREVNVSYSLELGRITAQEAFLNILRVSMKTPFWSIAVMKE